MMRTTILLLFLWPLSVFAQPINWDSVRTDYITKYQPHQIPAWLFPIIFEEGGGQRDTVYIGYDSQSLPGHDTVFGEKFIHVDTSKFNTSVCLSWFGCGGLCDSVVKVWVSKLKSGHVCGDAVFTCSFYNSRFPLTMYWDRAAFYSDSLPFYRDSAGYPPGMPKAYAELWCSNLDPYYDNCMLGGNIPPFLMPADPNGYFVGTHDPDCYFIEPDLSQPGYAGASPCIASDSIVIFGDTTAGTSSTPDWMPLTFKIRQYKKPVGIKEMVGNEHISVYPNPVLSHLAIESQAPGTAQYVITDLYGREVVSGSIDSPLTTVDLSILPPGAYVVRLMKGHYIAGTIVIKR